MLFAYVCMVLFRTTGRRSEVNRRRKLKERKRRRRRRTRRRRRRTARTESCQKRRFRSNSRKDLKEKLDKYENDKKSANKGEKTRRESVHAKFEGEKKDLEEKVEKMKIQFEKAAIESRTAMSKLEQENTSAKQFVADAQVNTVFPHIVSALE